MSNCRLPSRPRFPTRRPCRSGPDRRPVGEEVTDPMLSAALTVKASVPLVACPPAPSVTETVTEEVPAPLGVHARTGRSTEEHPVGRFSQV